MRPAAPTRRSAAPGNGARGRTAGQVLRTFGAQCVEVEVDLETGEVRVLRVVAAHDCGRVVNPTMVDSQVVGGITQGIGFALTEERVVDPARRRAQRQPGGVQGADRRRRSPHRPRGDFPDPEANPTGAKGIGEPPLVPTAPAIANAVFDAVGVRFRDRSLERREAQRG